MPSIEWVSPVIQLATAGGFGALVWYLVIKHIPFIELRHQEERSEWLRYIERRDTTFEDLNRQNIAAINRLHSESESIHKDIERIESAIKSKA